MVLPQVVSRDQWLTARRELLAREEQLSPQHAALVAARRRLPMVRIEKDYVFEGARGRATLPELFEGCRQLIVFHFMFDPAWDDACPSCSAFSGRLHPGLLAAMRARDTAFVAVSRASLAKLQASRGWQRWHFPWYSSFGSDFNYDFHVTLDERVAPVMYNFESKEEILAAGSPIELVVSEIPVEIVGLSCFIQDNGSVFHTYSTYDRGVEELSQADSLLELTALGGQA
ncbi:DUF899 domain-containing protein [Micromonospora zamorensis]|uniref:DUF899 domain-containing protein n=1 Tax=Micromonospora zamorensis TaxID=709883 RepID=UPI003D8A6299